MTDKADRGMLAIDPYQVEDIGSLRVDVNVSTIKLFTCIYHNSDGDFTCIFHFVSYCITVRS